MKRMKFLLFALISMVTITLVGCNAPCEVEYTNEEGQLVTLNVKPTEEKEEVYEAINALDNISAEEIEETKSIKLNMNAVVLIEDEDNLIDVKLGTKLEMNDKAQIYANIDMAAKYDLNFGIGFTQSGDTAIAGDVYTDSNNMYFNLVTKEDGKREEMKNKMSLAEALERLESLASNFGFDSLLPDMGATYLESSMNIPGLDISELGKNKEQALAYIEEHNIAIVATSKKTITFKVSLSGEELGMEADSAVDIIFGLDVNTLMPVSLEIDADEMMKTLKKEEGLKKAKFSFKMEIKYGDFEIKTLKDSEKDDYTDYSDVSDIISGAFGSLY